MTSATGLTSHEVLKLHKQHGLNKLESTARVTWPKVLFRQFTSLFILILLIAGLVTGIVLHEWVDAIVIIAAVLLNTFLGFIQEYRAEKSLAALKNLLTPMATVIRDGKRKTIPAEQLVPGDSVLLDHGTTVPADGQLVFADSLTVNEAILTGESMPVEKTAFSRTFDSRHSTVDIPPASQAFMGTTVTSGVGRMIVTAIGQSTKLGGIASSLKTTKAEKTPLQKAIDRLSKTLTVVILSISFLVFALGSLTGRDAAEMFGLSVAIAVAAIPEGLAVTLTVILSLGMRRILRRKALVRTLAAAETLGSTTVICTDKTGTITEGKMRVIDAISSLQKVPQVAQVAQVPRAQNRSYSSARGTRGTFGTFDTSLPLAALLCNDLHDPLEVAMDDWSRLRLADSASAFGSTKSAFGQTRSARQARDIMEQFPRLDEIPFSPERKYIATLHEIRDKGQGLKAKGGQTDEATRFPSSLSPHPLALLLVSGAPEVLLEKSTLPASQKRQWNKKFEDLGSQGLRLVAFAYKTISNDELRMKNEKSMHSTFDIRHSTFTIRHSHVSTLTWLGLLTFEDPIRKGAADALREAQRLGLSVHVITGDYLPTTRAVVDKLGVPDITIHARVAPEEKLQIVQKLQEQGEVIAMTGDGVNDAPALKKADIGIVVSTASDVSKETADMVLLDDNFDTITAAIIEGRGIRINLKRVITYLLSDNFSEIVLITGALLLGLPAPLLATQLLWINLISDGFPAIALTVDTVEKKEAQRPILDHALLTAPMKWIIGIVSWITGIFAFSLFIVIHTTTQDLTLARTIAFATLGTTTLLFVFSVRSLTTPVWRTKLFGNRWLTLAVTVGWLLQLAPIYVSSLQPIFHTTPLSLTHWFIVLSVGVATIAGIELAKWRFRLNHSRTL